MNHGYQIQIKQISKHINTTVLMLSLYQLKLYRKKLLFVQVWNGSFYQNIVCIVYKYNQQQQVKVGKRCTFCTKLNYFRPIYVWLRE